MEIPINCAIKNINNISEECYVVCIGKISIICYAKRHSAATNACGFLPQMR
jgi:hypothetical protein